MIVKKFEQPNFRANRPEQTVNMVTSKKIASPDGFRTVGRGAGSDEESPRRKTRTGPAQATNAAVKKLDILKRTSVPAGAIGAGCTPSEPVARHAVKMPSIGPHLSEQTKEQVLSGEPGAQLGPMKIPDEELYRHFEHKSRLLGKVELPEEVADLVDAIIVAGYSYHIRSTDRAAHVKRLEEQLDEKQKQINYLLNENVALSNSASVVAARRSATSYAGVVARTTPGEMVQRERRASNEETEVRITSADREMNGYEIEKIIKNNINPKDNDLGIKQVTVDRARNTVRIRVSNSRAAEETTNAINTIDKLEARAIEKSNPRVKLLDVPMEYSREDVQRMIFDKNSYIRNHYEEDYEKYANSFLVIGMTQPSLNKLRAFFCVLPAELREKMLDHGRINLIWSSHRWIDTVPIKQCAYCWKFGHTAAKCRNRSQPKCENCGEEDHPLDQPCPKNCLRCVNCADHNGRVVAARRFGASRQPEHMHVRSTTHKSTDKNCESYRVYKQTQIKNTKYITPIYINE